LTAKDIQYALSAMAAGLPIVSVPLPALDEFIFHLKNGLITEVEDSEALAQAFIKLQQNIDLKKRLGEEGKILIDNNYNLDRMIEQFENIIEINAKI
jgi:glycosyltransferase involved in cell wall biosynthesis